MRRFSWLLLISSLTLAAEGTKFDVTFAAQPLKDALTQFSRTTDQTILFDPALVSNEHTEALKGSFIAQDLLQELLKDSNLCASNVASGWLVEICQDNVVKSPEPAAESKPVNQIIEEITVTGFRDSLFKAREYKRLAMVSQDSILAEDIADFPDLNLADSLQRVPGISITREAGEGRQISLRGLGPDFTRVHINGMEALGITSSPMDARGSVSRSRAFDFNIFASELFNRIDVKKSYSARMEEGGIGGTVELFTPKPADYKEFTSAFSYRQAYNSNSQHYDPRVAGMIANTWGSFGALVSMAYSERHTTEYGTNTTRWRKENKTYVGPDNPALSEKLANGEFWFPRGHRYSLWNNDQTRLGITASLQYQPSENFISTVDILLNRLTKDLDEHHIAVKNNRQVKALEWVNNDSEKEVVYAEYKDATWRVETRQDYNESEFKQITFNSFWQTSPDASFNFLLGVNSSDYRQPKLNKVNIITDGVDIITDFRKDRFYGLSHSPEFDTTDPTAFRVKDLYFQENEISSDMLTFKADFDYRLTPQNSLKLGVSHKKLSNDGHERVQGDFPTNGLTPENEGNLFLPPEYTDVYTQHPDFNWLQGDLAQLQQHYGLAGYRLGEESIIDTSNYSVEEETDAAYFLFDFDMQMFGKTLLLSTGARFFETTLSSAGISKGIYTEIERDYSDWLPSLNMVLDITDNVLWRFGASKNITRPSIDKLSFSANVSQASRDEGDIGSIGLGNPFLQPFQSINIDTAIEWYFNKQGFISLALFHKNIDNFIVEKTELLRYGSLGLPEASLQEGESVDDLFIVTTPENSDSSVIQGAEFAFSRDFDFLPEPFNRLGMIANYTWADGDTLYRDVQGTGENQVKTFAGLSNQSYNLTLYYEAENWSARISSAYRSDYILSVQAGNTDQDESGYHDTTYVDAAAHYQLSDNFKLTLEALNLTNVREELYSDSSDRAYNTTSNGRTFLLGVSGQF